MSDYDVIVLGGGSPGESVGVEADAHGVPVDAHLRAAEIAAASPPTGQLLPEPCERG